MKVFIAIKQIRFQLKNNENNKLVANCDCFGRLKRNNIRRTSFANSLTQI
jgi:hypothetical protein